MNKTTVFCTVMFFLDIAILIVDIMAKSWSGALVVCITILMIAYPAYKGFCEVIKSLRGTNGE